MSEATQASTHNSIDAHDSQSHSQDTAQHQCGIHCHIAPHNLPQTVASAFNSPCLSQGRIPSTDDNISLSLYTVLDQPPRA